MKRCCEVCGSGIVELIHKQRFVLPSKYFFHAGYDIVTCKQCGFTFADNIPSQEFFDAYYQEMAKKSFYLNTKIFKASDKKSYYSKEMGMRLNHSMQNILDSIPNRKAKILDIGCYTGELLNLLKLNGFKHLTGVDPAPIAVKLAKERYGLKVIESNLLDGKVKGQYDYIIVTHVMEHIKDLRKFLSALIVLMAPGARIYIESPDAHNFFISDSSKYLPEHQEAYQQFSLEHINFFSKISLYNLMTGSGFTKKFLESQVSVIAILASVWERSSLLKDDWILPLFHKYLVESENKLTEVNAIVEKLVKSKEKIYIWGAGGHTQKMLALTNLMKTMIVAFVDSDPSYVGGKLIDLPIIAPDSLKKSEKYPILISSKGYQEQIVKEIKKRKLPNKIIRLYEYS